ncbi:outer membrane beta-barrel family protein [Dyadobacter tibetensis]|uniref:outer membrane beta-barrel family protein n=1 Tax=Dyadobacter tibetensis TaxID=1211851 RepID=UPI00046FA78D|nr:outer membrane beta-barrel family protein [Dyadobacter tibetensis]
MKNLYALICLFPCFWLEGLAQEEPIKKRSIAGKLIDNSSQAIPFATLALFTQTDSTLITGSNSDIDGFFALQAPEGSYYLKVSSLTHQDRFVDIELAGKDVDLGPLTLSTATQVLNEVLVRGEKSQMELQLDKRVFNVGKDLSNIGGTASMILNNVPSVTVDVDGNVALRGSQNVRILINGKQSGMIGLNPAEALKQIPADLIESIEVITNPSSRYDAEGEVGILNIIMKKNIRYGLNGTFVGTLGHPSNYAGSFNINYRKNKTNLIASYGLSYRESPGRGNSRQEYASADTSFVYEQINNRTRSGLSNTGTFGLDYFFNQYNTLTTTVSFRHSNNDNRSNLEYRDFDASDLLTRTVVREEREREPSINIEGAVNYRKTFEKKDQSLTVDLKYIISDETEAAKYRQYTLDAEDLLQQRSYNTEDEKTFLIQADYIHPLGENSRIEGGIKSSIRLLDNDFSVHQLSEKQNWQILPDFDNYLAYDERIHAGYIMGSHKLGKVFVQAGLRGEYSDIRTSLKKTNENNDRHYFNLFPSVHLSYEVDKKQTLQLSYSYRLSRPGFRNLLPFSNFSDSRVFRAGNPLLNPEYTHSYEAGHLINMDKGTLLSSIYYRKRTGVIEYITSVDSTGFTRITPINLSTGDSYGLEFNLTYDPFAWWKLSANANLFRSQNKGEYNDRILQSDTYSWNSRVTSRTTLLRNVDFQAALNYRAPRHTTQGRDLAMYALDLGLAKDIMKGNATVTLSVRDLLNSQKRRRIVENEGYYSRSEFQWRARQVLLSFSYRLNRSKERPKSNNDGNFGEEE